MAFFSSANLVKRSKVASPFEGKRTESHLNSIQWAIHLPIFPRLSSEPLMLSSMCHSTRLITVNAACTYVEGLVMTQPFDWTRGLGLPAQFQRPYACSLVQWGKKGSASALHFLICRLHIANISLTAGNPRNTEQSTCAVSVNNRTGS